MMMTASIAATQQTETGINGVNVDQLMNVITEIEADTEYAKFQWRANNQWIGGGLSRSQIKDFHAGNAEDDTRQKAFIVDADEPAIAAGNNAAPNSMEFVLHALVTCLTGTLVYHASVRGIEIEAVHSSSSGDMDVRGLFGMADDVAKGFARVSVDMRVKSAASVEDLTEMALFSPVHEMVSKACQVNFNLTKL
jgi:uncharacterized OsmC-like protein